MQFKFLKTRKKKKKKEKINVVWYLDTLITLQLNGLYIFCFSMHKSICSQRKIYGLLRSLCDRRISSTSVRYFPNCLEVGWKLSTFFHLRYRPCFCVHILNSLWWSWEISWQGHMVKTKPKRLNLAQSEIIKFIILLIRKNICLNNTYGYQKQKSLNRILDTMNLN